MQSQSPQATSAVDGPGKKEGGAVGDAAAGDVEGAQSARVGEGAGESLDATVR